MNAPPVIFRAPPWFHVLRLCVEQDRMRKNSEICFCPRYWRWI